MLPSGLVALAPGTVISGKYRVEGQLGIGGMGVVVAARHLDLNQILAIKVLLPSAVGTDEATTRFLREGRAAAQLTSPHVAKVHDTGRLPTGEPYLVMELLRGRDLRAYLTEVGRVSVAQAAEWVLQAAHALGEAHALNIIHRDVKPANLFLAETSAGQQIKVLDFGISKQLGSGEAELTNTASAVGTPRYMAPEQMRSARFADARGDVWSLGIVLYELTTGQHPFHGDSITALCFDVMERTPVPPSQLNPELPPAFDELVARCLEKDPSDRFQSMEALATALRAIAPASRSSALFNTASVQGAGPVAGVTPMPAVSTLAPAVVPKLDPHTGPQPLLHPRTMTLPAAQPLFSEPPAQETMRAWNTTAVPRPVAKKASRMPLIGLGIGIGIAIAVVVMMFIVDRESSPPSAASSAVSSAAPATALSAAPSIAPIESAVAPAEAAAPVSPSPPQSAIPVSSDPPKMAEPPKPTPPTASPCARPLERDEKGRKVWKKGCL
ncbi:MAG: serine/threonine protein kinase [Polyangiaceae bacterium]|nr:serine/threonine protein kinase [Polyangiaceae bacterium]